MHLLQAGVDLTVIALWLGHESPVTTHGYGKRPATPSPPGSPNSVFVSTPNDVDTNTLQFLLNSASAYACPAVGQ